jgi:hypothetical protein
MNNITTYNAPSSLDLCDEEKLKAYQERRSLTSKYNKVKSRKRRPSAGKSLLDWI